MNRPTAYISLDYLRPDGSRRSVVSFLIDGKDHGSVVLTDLRVTGVGLSTPDAPSASQMGRMARRILKSATPYQPQLA